MGDLYVIMVYFPSTKGYGVVLNFLGHALGHFAISASGCLIFSYSKVLTLNVCCGYIMSSPEFRRS